MFYYGNCKILMINESNINEKEYIESYSKVNECAIKYLYKCVDTANNNNNNNSKKNDSLSLEIIGIIIGCVLGIIILFILYLLYVSYSNNNNK